VTAALALVAAAALGQAAPQTPTFAVGVEGVYVDVFVSEGNRPVTGLVESDFELRADGRRRAIELVAVESLPLRTVIVLDTSDSVSGEKLRQLQAGIVTLLNGLRPGDETALLTFSQEIALRVPPTADRRRLESGVRAIRAGGATALYDALYAAAVLAGDRGRSLVVLFSDGEDNQSILGLAQVERALQESNVLVQTVGVLPRPPAPPGPARTLEPPEPESVLPLRHLAGLTGGRFWPAESPARLARAFGEVLEAMRTRYVLRFEPEQPQAEGLHEIEVKLARRSGRVQCRRAYFVPPASR
jgi:Ca-activated chloride channel family protein